MHFTERKPAKKQKQMMWSVVVALAFLVAASWPGVSFADDDIDAVIVGTYECESNETKVEIMGTRRFGAGPLDVQSDNISPDCGTEADLVEDALSEFPECTYSRSNGIVSFSCAGEVEPLRSASEALLILVLETTDTT